MNCRLVVLMGLLPIAAACAEPIVVDFSKEVGTVKMLNGVCNATPLSGSRKNSLKGLVDKLEIPHYRFHDAALENPGLSLVDVSRVFPLFHADPDNPENYDFGPTDDYLKSVVESGAEIEFRLGESIESSRTVYRVNPPADTEKWADICCHIIRHYNEGWADGFRWNIKRWSVWEEPDTNPQLLTGSPHPFKDIYLPLYATTARRIKREFPDLLIGGPQGGGARNMKLFVDYCAEHRIPLDFYGFTTYARHPEANAGLVRDIREYLDSNGFRKTEIVISEWHWGPVNWGSNVDMANRARFEKAWRDDLCGHDSTAFTAAMLVLMQDAPVDYMYYYAMKCSAWGLFDVSGTPCGSYYAMMAFARLAHGRTRVSAPPTPRPGWYVLASKDKELGRGFVLVSALRSDGYLNPIVLNGGVRPVSVKVIDPVHDLEEVKGWKWNAEKNELSVPRLVGDSTVWLIETATRFRPGHQPRLRE